MAPVTVDEVNESLTAERYRVFSRIDAAGLSSEYAAIANAIAEDADMLARIDRLPKAKRQAGFLLAVARYLGAPMLDYAAFRSHLSARWGAVESLAWERTMQTNDPSRLLALLPALAAIDGPIALLEVGSSAGLCLNLDRYSYRYGEGDWLHPADGPSAVRLETATRGPVPVPESLPRIVWRAGIDLNPLDVDDPDDARWLRALLWPDHQMRGTNFDAAIEILRRHPVRNVRGDLNDLLDEVVADAPDDATLVVMHSAVFPYLSQEDAERFVDRLRGMDAVWLGYELADLIPGVQDRSGTGEAFSFVVTVDGEPVAQSHPHADWLRWL